MSNERKAPAALLVFGIGPVQDFIATARRTQDLWMGSYILSYLMAEAMRVVMADDLVQIETGPYQSDRIIFPIAEGQPLLAKLRDRQAPVDDVLALASLPNKFTARVDSFDDGVARANAAQRWVHDKWTALAQDVAAIFPSALSPASEEWQKLWQAQIDPRHWIEVYWIVYPNTGLDYAELSEHAEQAFEARKRVREFEQTAQRGEKCTVCGTRSALSSAPDQVRSVVRQEWAALARVLNDRDEDRDTVYHGLAAALDGEGDERLCAVCTNKRFAQRFFFESKIGLRGGFPSTSSMATVKFREALLAPAIQGARNEFVRVLHGKNGQQGQRVPETLAVNAFPPLTQQHPGADLLKFDGDVFFPETFTRARLKDDYGLEVDDVRVGELKAALRRLRGEAKRASLNPPCKYYAVLLMDGDNLGQHLRAAKTADEHRAISQHLLQFALERVKPIVEEQALGRVVYAGGDDVMAFLPLETALIATRDLREAFGQATHGFTISAGLVIAHHLAPLDLVLEAAREAEHQAKSTYGKDAIVVSVLKRSGEQLDVGAGWQYGAVQPTDIATRLAALFKSGAVSPKFAFDAESEARAITGVDQDTHQKLLARLLARHSQTAKDLPTELAQLGEGLRGQALPAETSPTLETARWLLLARFIAAALSGEE